MSSDFDDAFDPVMSCRITDLGSIAGAHFSLHDKARRIRVADDEELIALVVECQLHGLREVQNLAEAEQRQRVEIHRFGEAMLAAATANSLERKGVRWGMWGVWLAVGSILLTILIALMQQC